MPVAPTPRPTRSKTGGPTRSTSRAAAKPSAAASDADLIATARARLAQGHEPSATWLMNTHGIGAKRAARIRDAAKAPAPVGGEH
ncbi:hypothetical protein [Streptomyces sp. ERV7]|uniref:hypothetical protein n=1 Tax=Streptomyces sp. ERV7 TaxID=1322334 RepID=UPI00131B2200|nr:hypothetical protein [Streptomyces sp. ERV7]